MLMKLLVILCVEDLQETVARLLHDTGISRMGVVPYRGYRKSARCTALGWFGRGSACEQADSLLMFSFTEETLARQAVVRIDQYNGEHASHFVPRAYVLDVDAFSELMNG